MARRAGTLQPGARKPGHVTERALDDRHAKRYNLLWATKISPRRSIYKYARSMKRLRDAEAQLGET